VTRRAALSTAARPVAETVSLGLLDAPQPAPPTPVEPTLATEYLRPGIVRCDCPRHVNSSTPAPVIVLRHRPGCEERHPDLATEPPYGYGTTTTAHRSGRERVALISTEEG
jgi:hypothetical protein